MVPVVMFGAVSVCLLRYPPLLCVICVMLTTHSIDIARGNCGYFFTMSVVAGCSVWCRIVSLVNSRTVYTLLLACSCAAIWWIYLHCADFVKIVCRCCYAFVYWAVLMIVWLVELCDIWQSETSDGWVPAETVSDRVATAEYQLRLCLIEWRWLSTSWDCVW